MNSIGDDCTELKKQYDACFNAWFAERFLKGATDDSICSSLFKSYQDCVKRAMREQKIEFPEVDADFMSNPEGSSSNKNSS